MSMKRGLSAGPRGPTHGPIPTVVSEEDRYRSKLKALKRKVKEMEEDTLATQTKLLKSKQNILRLRLERSFLFERLSTLRQQTLGLASGTSAALGTGAGAGQDGSGLPRALAFDSSMMGSYDMPPPFTTADYESFASRRADSPESTSSIQTPHSTSRGNARSSGSGTASARKTKREIDANAPKRPTNAFLRFCDVVRPIMKQDAGDDVMTDYTKVLGAKWAAMPEEEKKPYKEAYANARKQYDAEMKEYMETRVPAPSSLNANALREGRAMSSTPLNGPHGTEHSSEGQRIHGSDGLASSSPPPQHGGTTESASASASPLKEKRRTQMNPKSLANLKRGRDARAKEKEKQREKEKAIQAARESMMLARQAQSARGQEPREPVKSESGNSQVARSTAAGSAAPASHEPFTLTGGEAEPEADGGGGGGGGGDETEEEAGPDRKPQVEARPDPSLKAESISGQTEAMNTDPDP